VPEPDAYQANLHRGAQLLALNRPREAIPYFENAIAASPRSAHAFAQLARAWNEIPAHRAKAIPIIDQAIALAPTASACFGLKSWFLLCQTRYMAAKTEAKKGIALNPLCVPSLNALANAETRLHQWRNVETTCLRVLQINPNDGPALNLIAQALRHLGRWTESREIVARLLANRPNDAFGHANAGYAALTIGDHLRANEHFLESLRLDPHFDLGRRGLLESLRSRVWIIRTNRYLRRPGTLRNLIIATIILGAIMLVGYLADVLNALHPKAGDFFAMTLIGAGLLYIYLSFVVYLMVNFLLLFDPVGRHALTQQEKGRACIPVVFFAVVLGAMVYAQAWVSAAVSAVVFAILVLSIQFPLLKDRYLRRREAESID
jgi:tetratricopeptide (TPR) repeat protein